MLLRVRLVLFVRLDGILDRLGERKEALSVLLKLLEARSGRRLGAINAVNLYSPPGVQREELLLYEPRYQP